MTDDEQFFYDNAGYSYDPERQTADEGRRETATKLARAESAGRRVGLSFAWQVDHDVDSSEFSDEMPPWSLWECIAYNADGKPVASLHGIDFGRDGSPHSSPYRRVVEAELAAQSLSNNTD